jgi:hypothetical protein
MHQPNNKGVALKIIILYSNDKVKEIIEKCTVILNHTIHTEINKPITYGKEPLDLKHRYVS